MNAASLPSASHPSSSACRWASASRSARPAGVFQGERARLLLIRALMAEPERVIAEDPLGALDPATAERVLDALDAEPVHVVIR